MAKTFEVEVVLKFQIELSEEEIDKEMKFLNTSDRAYAETDAAYGKVRELGLENYDDIDFSVKEIK